MVGSIATSQFQGPWVDPELWLLLDCCPILGVFPPNAQYFQCAVVPFYYFFIIIYFLK